MRLFIVLRVNKMPDKKSEDYAIEDSGERKVYETGANRDISTGKGRFDLLPPQTIKALARHYQKGCEKYGERNWEKGIPIARFIDSALRHTFQFLDGKDDENHLISAIWNLVGAYETVLRIQEGRLPEELYDLPRKAKLPIP